MRMSHVRTCAYVSTTTSIARESEEDKEASKLSKVTKRITRYLVIVSAEAIRVT